MKIVVLDAYHINPGDLSWEKLDLLGKVDIYDFTSQEELYDRAKGAQILLTNKVVLDAKNISRLPDLRCICVMATGYNNVDTEYAREKNITVCNVAGYSTESVAQQVFASIFAVYNKIETYADQVRKGIWTSKQDWSYTIEPISNVQNKVLGVLGFGRIGKRVSELGLNFGMEVIAYHKYPERDPQSKVRFVDLDELFRESDVLSLHVPLNKSTHRIMNKSTLNLMKKNSILINMGRGGLVDEKDLFNILNENNIKAAVLDVLNNEPPKLNNPLLSLKNCYITPHVAWAGKQSRRNLIELLIKNVEAYIDGNPINTVN